MSRSPRVQLVEAGSGTGPEADLVLPGAEPAHRVQFYESEDFLALAVAEFLAAGLTVGQSLVVIATEPHRAAFVRHLKAGGFDIDQAAKSGQLTLLDARSMLATFMVGGEPDARLFRSSIGAALENARSRAETRPALRLYGEMVDLLWREGNAEGALRLEELWNELAGTFEFQLLCAYAMGNFCNSSDSEGFRAICGHHTHVVPTERYVQAGEDTRLLEITILEQRARALEAEIEYRQQLELRLRELLAEREHLLEAERVAREEAESASRAKSQFLAVMSHELRTPLNAIAGHVQLLDMGVYGTMSDSQRDALDRVARSQRHLLRLVSDVLNLSRVESGHMEYAIDDVCLQEVVGDLLAIIEPQLAAKGLALEVRLPEQRVVVRADREKLGQVLLNLLSNAAKFTPPGGRITLDVATRAAVPRHVFVRVSDTGAGIARAKHEVIFEPFVQVHAGPTRPADGAGLGLAISRDLARGMGGDVRVRSVEGEGSVFTVTLERADGGGQRAE